MWKCARCETLNDDDAKTCALCQRTKPEIPAAEPDPATPDAPPAAPVAPADPAPKVRDLRNLRFLAATPALAYVLLMGSNTIPVVPLLVLVGLWAGISSFVTLGLQSMGLGGRMATAGRALGAAALTGLLSLLMVSMYESGNGLELSRALVYFMPALALIHTGARIVIFAVNGRKASRVG